MSNTVALVDNQNIQKTESITTKSRALNDYILRVIFSYIEIKDLFCLSRVSKQFEDTIDSVLQMKRLLTVGPLIQLEYNSDDNIGIEFLCLDRIHCLIDNVEQHAINSALIKKSDNYYISESVTNFQTISRKCQSIESLVLKDCYLDEKSFELIEQNLSQLKCLTLIEGYLGIPAPILITKKYFSKTLIHLSISKMSSFEPNFEYQSTTLLLIKNLERLQTLKICIKNDLFKDLIQVLSPTLRSLFVGLDLNQFWTPSLNQTIGSIEKVKTLPTLQSLKCVYIEEFYLTNVLLKVIIESLDLFRFSFSCRRLKWKVLSLLVQKQQNLMDLRINWSKILDNPREEVVITPLKSLIRLHLHDLKFTSNSFKQFMDLFPSVRVLRYTYVHIYCLKDHDSGCLTCNNWAFGYLSRFVSLKKLLIVFPDIKQSFIDRLSDYKCLQSLDIYKYWRGMENKKDIDKYEENLRKILMTFIEMSTKSPKKLFRIRLCENSVIPPDLNYPKNLLIYPKLKLIHLKYF